MDDKTLPIKIQDLILLGVVLVLISVLLIFNKPDYTSRYKITNTGLIHGIYPGGFSGEEDDFTEADVISYERAVGKKAAFIYFSNNWYKTHEFPKAMVDMIYARNSIPYVRLMLRSNQFNQGFKEKEFTMERILAGRFDEDFHKWFQTAATYKKPMFAEFGIEVNGDWFNWSGTYNGGPGAGPDNFKRAYQHIITMSREDEATNIIWSFHINDKDAPDVEWNHFENYYPGDNYIDLVNFSIYGMLTSKDTQPKYVGDVLKTLYPRVLKMAPDKKMLLIEWASTKDNKHQNQVVYARDGFEALLSGKYPNLIGFSYWNEWWHNDHSIDSTMRVQDSPKLAKTFRKYLSNPKIDNILKVEKK
jgi:hypothetical protein